MLHITVMNFVKVVVSVWSCIIDPVAAIRVIAFMECVLIVCLPV